MKKMTLLFMVALVMLVTGCSRNLQPTKSNDVIIHGTGNILTREISLTEFDSLEAGLMFNLTIRQGDRFKVTLSADDNFIDFIQVKKVGSTLVFDLKPDYAYNIYNVTMRAEVTMPDLAGLTLNGSSHALLFDAQSLQILEAELTGSSVLEGSLRAESARFDLSGSTYVNISGSANQIVIDSCGNSIANLERFAVENAELEVSCNSTTSIRVNGRLNVDASQFSQVFYTGNPAFGEIMVNESASFQAK